MKLIITEIEKRDPTSRFRQSYTAVYIHHTSDNEIMGYEIYDNEVQKDWVFISALNLKPSKLETLKEMLEAELERIKGKTFSFDNNEPA